MRKKKSLGQHFLHAQSYLTLIADSAKISPGDAVLEIGPGDGALTAELLKRGARVLAIEKDHRLIAGLSEKFAGLPLTVIEGDALTLDISRVSLKKGYKIVANIPYYITGALLKKFLTAQVQPRSMTLLVQKEVAERIARNKKESILSLSVKAYGDPRYIKTVPRGAFAPPPNVDSALLRIENISRERFTNREEEELFFTLVRAGFGQKRKLLRRNLEHILGTYAQENMKRSSIPEDARAEDVTIEKWIALTSESGKKASYS